MQIDIEFGDDDMVWVDPSADYGSPWDLCHTLSDADGAPVFIEPGQATVDNFFILFDAGERVTPSVMLTHTVISALISLAG